MDLFGTELAGEYREGREASEAGVPSIRESCSLHVLLHFAIGGESGA